MRTTPFLRALLVCFLFCLPAHAQMPGQSPAPAPAGPTSEAKATTADPTRALVDILRDEAAREALIRKLLATTATPATAEKSPAPPPDEPSTLARQIADTTRDAAEGTMAFVVNLGRSWRDVADVLTGTRPINWSALQDGAAALGLVILVTIALYLGLRATGQRIYAAMSRRTGRDNWYFSLLWILASSVIDGLIIVLAWAGGYAFALAIGETGTMNVWQSLFLNAFLLVELVRVALRAVFAPRFNKLRFAPMSDETAAYWYFWSSRLIGLLGYGLLFVVPILNDLVSFAAAHSVRILVVVTALLLAILIILQNRTEVRSALRARHERHPGDAIGRAEAAIAGVWHWLAIGYLLALFLAWSIGAVDSLQFMLIATLNSIIAIVIGVVAMTLIKRVVARGMRVPEEIKKKLPLLEVRLNAFVPMMLQIIRAIIIGVVLIAIAQAWHLMNIFSFLATETGRDISSRFFSIALIAILGFLAWLAMSSFVEYRLNPTIGKIATARERTLLSLLRNAFVIGLVLIVAMLILSEIGVNIGPLLAGAGVLGLAIGFGAQKLVQDIITGAFIQFENAMNEGDVVTVGGTSGVVERLTIRSVGLRDLSGTYHLIPFSSVDLVSNFMKGFAFHLAEIRIPYRESISKVKELLLKAYDILKDTEHGEAILEPLEIQGVSSLEDSGFVYRVRIKTRPGMQWSVGRAYNEIVKDVLQDARIQISTPHLTVYMGQDRSGSAPALNLRHLGETPRGDLSEADMPDTAGTAVHPPDIASRSANET